MKETSLDEQNKRRYISADWEPNGFERYVYQRALTRAMPVVGGIGDGGYVEQRRYTPATSCQESLDCHCGKGAL
jgi:hypothetical protein